MKQLLKEEKRFKKLIVDVCNNLVGIDIRDVPYVLGSFADCNAVTGATVTGATVTGATVTGATVWNDNSENMFILHINENENKKYGIINDKLMVKDGENTLEEKDNGIKYIVPFDKTTYANKTAKYLWCIKNDNKLYRYTVTQKIEDIIGWDTVNLKKSKDVSIDIDGNIWSIAADSNFQDKDRSWVNRLARSSIYKNEKHIKIDRWDPGASEVKTPEEDNPTYWNSRILANNEDYIYRIDNKNDLFKCKKPCNYGKWTEVEIEKANSDKFQSDKNSLYFLKDNKIKYKNMLDIVGDFDYKCLQGTV
jgi:hypothetical protein